MKMSDIKSEVTKSGGTEELTRPRRRRTRLPPLFLTTYHYLPPTDAQPLSMAMQHGHTVLVVEHLCIIV